MKTDFRVRVFPESGPPIVLRGAIDMRGPYVVTREPSGTGFNAIPEKRVGVPADRLRSINDGKADYELTVPMPASSF